MSPDLAKKGAGIDVKDREKGINGDGLRSSIKNANGAKDDNEPWRPMIIDLELQRLDSILLRFWNGFKYFF